MKLRTGFVSNSSSSSFLLLSLKSNPEKIKLKIETTIEELVEFIIKTPDDLEQFVKDRYGETIKEMKAQGDYFEVELEGIDKILEQINQGLTVFVCNCSSDSSPIEQYLYQTDFDDIKFKDAQVLTENL